VNKYAVVNESSGIVENVVIWDGSVESGWSPPDGYIAVESDQAQIGWMYMNGVFTAPPVTPPPPPTPQEISAANIIKLQVETQLAAAQKAALQNRIGTLNDAIDLEIATGEEVEELPIRQAQLLDWKRYAVYLGRVTLQEGWALTVEWPVQPASGMDLSVSGLAPEQA